MSLKTKLISLITTFVLLCSLLTVGVFAVKNTTFNVGGNIEFKVKGIEADIELTTNGVQNAKFNNNEEIGKDVLKKIEIRNNTSAESVASQFAKWSNLDMSFAQGQSTATIELKITNRATEEDNYIDITALADATTKENARIKVANNAGGITALLKSGKDATFTITFEVKDDEYKANLNDFSVNFDMQKKVIDDFPSYDADPKITITCDTDSKTALVTGNNITEANTEIDVPKYVKSGDVVCAVTSIKENAFSSCSNLISITIPESVTNIGGSAFKYCYNITNITILEGVTSIGEYTFSYCYDLTNITIPGSVTSIGEYTFSDCYGLTSITISDSVTSIGECTFLNCPSLESITIPDSVTSIGNRAFGWCESLTSITIPDSVEAIGDWAFSNCDSLTTVNYRGTQAEWNALLENVGEGKDSLTGAEIHFNYTGA